MRRKGESGVALRSGVDEEDFIRIIMGIPCIQTNSNGNAEKWAKRTALVERS